MDVNDPERGSVGFRLVKLPPSKPIDEKWLSRRRVSVISIALVAALLLGRIGSCSTPPAPGTVSNNQLEAFSRLNTFRGPDLVPTAELMVKAQDWSAHMADEGRLSHSTLPDGLAPGWQAIGENVAVSESLAAAQAQLEGSPGHRANMVNPAYSEAGVGVTVRDGRFWLVQDLLGR